eukprot:1045738-Amphidinium_carterae.1
MCSATERPALEKTSCKYWAVAQWLELDTVMALTRPPCKQPQWHKLARVEALRPPALRSRCGNPKKQAGYASTERA